MKHRGVFVAGAAIVVVLGCVLFLIERDAPSPSATASAQPVEDTPNAEAFAAAPDNDAAPALAPEHDPRTPLAGKETTRPHTPPTTGSHPEVEAPPTDGVDILILRAEDREPVAAAHVACIDEHSFTPEEILSFQSGDVSFDEFLATRGRHFRSNEQGLARIPRASGFGFLAASKGDLFGFAQYDEGGEQGLEVLLHFDPELTLRVVDPHGVPQGGVPIFLRSIDADSGERQDYTAVLSAEQTGLALLPHVLRLVEETDMEGSPFAAARILAAEQIELAIPVDPFPSEPVELTIPACGQIEVRILDPEGGLVDRPCVVKAVSLAPDVVPAEELFRSNTLAQTVSENGIARFAHVALDQRLAFHIQPSSGYSAVLESTWGPSSAGEQIDFEVYLRESRPFITGRVLDGKGAPISNALCRAIISPRHDPFADQDETNFRTDATGRLRFAFPDYVSDSDAYRLELTHLDPKVGLLSTVVQWPGHLQDGENDLGQVTLEPAPPVAAGSVRGTDGRAVYGASIRVLVATYANGTENWREIRSLDTTTDASGAFAIRGRVDVDRVALVARHDDYLQSQRQIVKPGDQSIEIQLEAAGTVHGRVLVDDFIPTDAFTVEATYTAFDGEKTVSQRAGEDGEFEFSRLPSGTCELRARLRSDRSCAGERVLVQVDPTAAPDAAPALLDLRGRIRSFEIELIAPNDLAIEGYLQAFPAQDERPVRYGILDGRAQVTTCRTAINLEVFAAGFRAEKLFEVAADQVVRLRPGLPVVFATSPTPPTSAGRTLQVEIRTPSGEWVTNTAGFDQDGRAVALFRQPGSYQGFLRVLDTLQSRGGSLFQSQEPLLEFQVDERADAQVIEFALPEAARRWLE